MAGRIGRRLIDGMEVVEGLDVKNLTFHDPHCVRLCPSNPDRLYQQNHCGIYRLDRPSKAGSASARRCPKRSAISAFRWRCIPATMSRLGVADGRQTVWPRTSSGRALRLWHARRRQKLAAAGQRPAESPGLVDVKRQAMAADGGDPVGLYFGTTSGELWMSRDEGETWDCMARHLAGNLRRRGRWDAER